MIINFKDVGRDKRSWTKAVDGRTITPELVAKEAKRGGGLMSREIDAEFNDEGTAGVIYVGEFRPVGTFTISQSSF